MWLLLIPVLVQLLLGVFSIAVFLASLYLIYRWFQRPVVPVLRRDGEVVADTRVRVRKPLWLLLIPCGMLLFTFTGRQFALAMRPAGEDEPRAMRSGAVQELTRPDGTRIHVETLVLPLHRRLS